MLKQLCTEPGVSEETALLLLKRIGSTLRLPTSAFFDGPAAPALADLAQTGELLRLWTALRSERDRSAVLGFLRDRAGALAE